MIKTGIATHEENGKTFWLQSEGLAKNESVFKWLMEFSGWALGENCVNYQIYRYDIEWDECNYHYPCDMTEQYILGHCVHLN